MALTQSQRNERYNAKNYRRFNTLIRIKFLEELDNLADTLELSKPGLLRMLYNEYTKNHPEYTPLIKNIDERDTTVVKTTVSEQLALYVGQMIRLKLITGEVAIGKLTTGQNDSYEIVYTSRENEKLAFSLTFNASEVLTVSQIL